MKKPKSVAQTFFSELDLEVIVNRAQDFLRETFTERKQESDSRDIIIEQLKRAWETEFDTMTEEDELRIKNDPEYSFFEYFFFKELLESKVLSEAMLMYR